MRTWKGLGGLLALSLLVVLGSATDPAEAGGTLFVRKFLVGRLEENTGKFIATGARGSDDVPRDAVLLFVFSAPVDLDTLDDRTVRIGVPTQPGLILPAEGSFHRYVVRKFDPVTATYRDRRVYRNRVLFDPTRRFDDPLRRNPDGFEANALHTVTLPGLDRGALKTVRSRKGKAVAFTFTTTFRTTDRYFLKYW